jgi:hypothetical protein
LLVRAESLRVRKTAAEVGAGRTRVIEGNVSFRETQMVLEHVRLRPHQAFEQLETDFGVAVLEQPGGGHDVQGAEQARCRSAAKVGIELPAPPCAALDLRDQVRSQETLLLYQSARDRGSREHRLGGVFLVHPHDVVRVLTIGRRIPASRDQGFERVRQCQRVLPIGRRGELAMDGASANGARRAEAEKRDHEERRTASDEMRRTHLRAAMARMR